MNPNPQEPPSARYLFETLVGKGAHSSVYRGRDRETGALVALKVLGYKASKKDPQLLQRFEREAELIRRLEHPRIVKTFGCFREDERRIIVLEWAPGGALKKALHGKKGGLPLARAVSLTHDICEALVQTRRLGIVHGDIKPANVLLGEDGRAKLSDFGVARFFGATADGDTPTDGSLAYLSPQALRGHAPDARNDLWTLGVLLFELLAGCRPFADQGFAKLIHSVCQNPPARLSHLRPDCPPQLESLVVQMLEKDPDKRIQTAAEIQARLEDLGPLSDRPPGLS